MNEATILSSGRKLVDRKDPYHGFGLYALWQRENVRRARFGLPPSLPPSRARPRRGHKTRWGGIIFSGGHEGKEEGWTRESHADIFCLLASAHNIHSVSFRRYILYETASHFCGIIQTGASG